MSIEEEEVLVEFASDRECVETASCNGVEYTV